MRGEDLLGDEYVIASDDEVPPGSLEIEIFKDFADNENDPDEELDDSADENNEDNDNIMNDMPFIENF